MPRQSPLIEGVVAPEVETAVFTSANFSTYVPHSNGGRGTTFGLVIIHLRLQSEVEAPNAAPPLTAFSPRVLQDAGATSAV
ncbi:hypothetical protein G7043_31300 [Lentzea sp. NEAU-D13]|uniref:Uncharacterized protein n=1 Tax=Lentzea alba TaxID=2714351 RepID=A0A7C9W535_9PSEU|nr:hypothetical protein [Lentzea alba]NGY63419.1 hypothetical protein [Lentzea alba]